MDVIVPEQWEKELPYSSKINILRCIPNIVQGARMVYSIPEMSLITIMVDNISFFKVFQTFEEETNFPIKRYVKSYFRYLLSGEQLNLEKDEK